ncbi:phosphoglucosamine mutase [Candidatus Fokinia crypta]|uniref:Phosphoglucosamine mutase n=1 Tax=Candidatus Fokinia crypta TaxID=1920990 RepID=A0ABZ0UPQ2_9RICK|nr:phosphoglucosamine mutase [Candidatus Fokinia cryptica]WPX97872.1 Phosphoglucosamine mutase [Candidatus Fokinia cryptica]
MHPFSQNFNFGTDGIRGLANGKIMNSDVALRLGQAIGIYLKKYEKVPQQHVYKVIIGKDTRLSCYMLESAITAGFTSVGVHVKLVGPIPTPAISYLVRSMRCDVGIMITASHNNYDDNGIKIFDRNGIKIYHEVQEVLKTIVIDQTLMLHNLATSYDIGKVSRIDDVHGRYIEYVKSVFSKHLTLDGRKIVVDCANGATYKVAPTVFKELGAEVISIGVEPNGLNINKDCGALCTTLLQEKVKSTGADIGFAFDGDGDRLVVCDENGNITSGEYLIACVADYIYKDVTTIPRNIVITKLCNAAFSNYMKSRDFNIIYSDVGDGAVMRTMVENKALVGGEISGHIMIRNSSQSSDAIIASMYLLSALQEQQTVASKMLVKFSLYPQLTFNLKYHENVNPLDSQDIQRVIQEIIEQNKDYRIIVRSSGTEDVVRIMIEGQDTNKMKNIMNTLVNILSNR